MAQKGTIPALKIGVVGAHWRFRPNDVKSWLNRGRKSDDDPTGFSATGGPYDTRREAFNFCGIAWGATAEHPRSRRAGDRRMTCTGRDIGEAEETACRRSETLTCRTSPIRTCHSRGPRAIPYHEPLGIKIDWAVAQR